MNDALETFTPINTAWDYKEKKNVHNMKAFLLKPS